VSAYVRRHFTMLGGVLLLILAWSYRLGMYELLSSGSGNGGLFSFIDDHVVLPGMLLLSIVTLGAAVVVAWAGWSGQIRLAFIAVSTVLILSLISRTVAPLVVRRSVSAADQHSAELGYMGTRLAYTRRAYGVDRMRAESLGTGFANPSEAAARLAIWDTPTLTLATERMRRGRVVGDGAHWQATGSGLAALLVEHGNEGTPDGRDVWGVDRFDPTVADDRGLPVRPSGAALASYDLVLPEPAVYDSAPSYSVLSDSLQRLAGVEMSHTSSRLMHAWALQNFRLLFGDLPASRPVMVQRRAVRERLEALVPFFVQGGEVLPVIAADSLYWVVELYSASSTYPLSQRIMVLGEERGYFQHAATAVIHAASGRVRIIGESSPEAIAASWQMLFPQLFRASTTLPPAVRAALPPITDGARTQALAYAVAGLSAKDTLDVKHFAPAEGTDSSAYREPAHAVLPGLSGVALTWPLLDSTERVRGVVAASGGPTRVTSWIPMTSEGNRWGATVERLRMADSAQRETSATRASVHVVPLGGVPLYVQPTFLTRPGATPTLAHVATAIGDSVRVAPSLSAALNVAPRVPSPAATPAQQLRADSLYRVMRDALGHGDWAAFGRAFDALGLALRVTRP
ncbi:MAG: UPF0182 family protein, partial [Gemmatimonadaceae bacterium]